jgi:hypothetical protein
MISGENVAVGSTTGAFVDVSEGGGSVARAMVGDAVGGAIVFDGGRFCVACGDAKAGLQAAMKMGTRIAAIPNLFRVIRMNGLLGNASHRFPSTWRPTPGG